MSAFHVQKSHRVLAIPELLDMIFGFLDDIYNAYNAQVCKVWATVALDVIWKEPCNLHRLFSRLAPLVMVDHRYMFAHLPTAAQWEQFDRYASRVRKLVYFPQDSDCEDFYQGRDGVPLSRRIFDDIARTRLRMDIFPNLHTLVWMPPSCAGLYTTYQRQIGAVTMTFTSGPDPATPWDATVFMHPRVKAFAFHLPTYAEHMFSPTASLQAPGLHILTEQQFTEARGHFLLDIASRMPALRTLDVRTSLRASSLSSRFILQPNPHLLSSPSDSEPATRTLQDDLADLILALPFLYKLILPRFSFTTRIAEAASRLSHLGVVEFQYLPSQGCGWMGDLFPPSGNFAPDLSFFSVNSKASVSSSVKLRAVSPLRLLTGADTSTHNITPTTPPFSREEGLFPALYDLSLTSTFSDLATFLDGPNYNPSRLTSIYVDSACVVETNPDVGRLADVLRENCGMLRYIALVSKRDPGAVPSLQEHADGAMPNDARQPEENEEDGGVTNQCITLPTILPILALPLLTSLELTHAFPLGLSLSDIATIACSLPSLETLLLNTEPVYLYLPVPSPVKGSRRSNSRVGGEHVIDVPGLEVLSVVARRCRFLRHFGVFLDATGVGDLHSTAARSLKQVGGSDGSVPPSPVKRALRALPFSVDPEPDEDERAGADSAAADSLTSFTPALFLSFSASSPTFSPTLARLSLGVSAISNGDADAAALYLSHVLPLGCVIDFGVTWDEGLVGAGGSAGGGAPTGDDHMDADMDDDGDENDDNMPEAQTVPVGGILPGHGQALPSEAAHLNAPLISSQLRRHRTHCLHVTVQARCAVWERVAAQVPLLARLRQEERARTRAMEKELEGLRAREDRRTRETEGGVVYGHSSVGAISGVSRGEQGKDVTMNLAAAAATRKTSWSNLKELGREWLHL